MFITFRTGKKSRKKNIKGTTRVHVVSMLDPPGVHIGNLDITGDSPHTCTGIVLYLIQHSLLVVWCPYSLLTFLCLYDEGSAVGQSPVLAWLGVFLLE
ncbi:uncharacterized protein TNCV_3842061 [Trichonephila clavipes]|nr:uncharacterized protein TNCV_3842061 [Trichonephila clavipes]